MLTCGGGDGTSCGGEGQGTGRKQATIIGKGRRRTSDEDVASGRGATGSYYWGGAASWATYGGYWARSKYVLPKVLAHDRGCSPLAPQPN